MPPLASAWSLTLETDVPKQKVTPLAEAWSIASSYMHDDTFLTLEFQEAFLGFVKNRNIIDAPLTERAIKLTLTTLRKLELTHDEAIEALDQPSHRGWKGVFRPNTGDNKFDRRSTRGRRHTRASGEYEEASGIPDL